VSSGIGSTAELREIEASCVEKFRRRARELQRGNPALTVEEVRYKSIEQQPQVAARYNFARNILGDLGVPSLPLWE
jgi:hypothetical protein